MISNGFELRHLRAFVVVAETLNFRVAAERLHIAQPALSKQIQKLEHDVGVRLFERGRDGTRLSPEGARFLPRAWEVIRAAEGAVRSVAYPGDHRVRPLRLGVTEIAIDAGFTRFVAQRAEAYDDRPDPPVSLTLHTECTEVLAERVGEGSLDAAILHPPIHGGTLDWEDLYNEPVVFVGAESLLEELDRDATAEVPLILFERRDGPMLFDAVFAVVGNAGRAARVVYESERFSDRLLMAEQGLGVTVATPAMVRHGLRLARWELPGLPRIETALAFRPDAVPPAVRMLASELRAFFAPSFHGVVS